MPRPAASVEPQGLVQGRLVVHDLNGGAAPERTAGVILVGVDRSGEATVADPAPYDLLLTTAPEPSAPFVSAPYMDASIRALSSAIAARPLAALTLIQLLRLGLPFEGALVAESVAYSMLLAAAEFANWRRVHPLRHKTADLSPRVRLERQGEALEIRLSRPQARNAVDARMRDELVEALEFAAVDPGAPPILLTGEGPAFSAGGDLEEFGAAADPALAHAIRVAQSPARLVQGLRGRVTARLHGACVGAGIEIPAAAGRVVASPDAWFQLPEVGMGLIPGAGGTASIPPRIGRHRTAWMALTGVRVSAADALDWGLVDAVEDSR